MINLTSREQFIFGWRDACERYIAGESCCHIEDTSTYSYVGKGQRAAVEAIRGHIDLAHSVADKVGLTRAQIEALIALTLDV